MLLSSLLNPLSFYFAIVVMIVAFAAAAVLARVFHDHSPIASDHFATLDALRGYLSMAVFIHHSSIWYFKLRDGGDGQISNFYNNLGQASVALFFMITAFLFFGKLLNAKGKKIDWYRLYISRILRIFPLYIFASLLMIFAILALTNFTLGQPLLKVVGDGLKFLHFRIPDINGVGSREVGAGVIWTLRWERSFYITLPLFGFFLGLNVSRWWFLIAAVLAIPAFVKDKDLISLCFVGGIIAAFVVKNKFHLGFFKKSTFGLFAWLCLFFEISYFKTSFHPCALILLTIFFLAAIADNKLVKIINFKASRLLSTISYSIYLLHGVILFVIFKFVIGFEVAKSLSVVQHWGVIAASGVIVILVSLVTYHFIELPFLNLAKSKNLFRPNFVRFFSFSKSH
ncbi:MAG: acyltransferase [Rickettsiaceae bacterium]|jgi:peptidoglycan/LPS O-acetylase OafA/YrhL|nr:acyltransferase [Rickettsiaceae bacterium]